MNEKTTRVFNGWLALTEAERDELDKAVREYKATPIEKRARLRESTRDRATKCKLAHWDKVVPAAADNAA
jgi:hypothetical protein